MSSNQELIIPRGPLEIPRSQMPQIALADYTEFFALLAHQNIKVKRQYIVASNLKAAQCEINRDKVCQWVEKMPDGAQNKPCIVSRDNYVIDGNHTWLALLNTDPNNMVDCFWIDMDCFELLNTCRTFSKVFSKTVNEATMQLFDIPESLIAKVRRIMAEEVHPADDEKVLTEKGKKDLEEEKMKEKIIINPLVEPDKMAEPDKIQKTV